MIPFNRALIRLREQVSPVIVAHCLAVSDTAAELAPVFGVDTESARWAGLLHDCARELSPEGYLEEARRSGLRLYDAERERPLLLHQRLGALWASERYDVPDPAVLAAIRTHTTGGGNMDALARCVMTADRVSPDRAEEDVGHLRVAVADGPEAAFRAVLADKRRRVALRRLPEHPWALEAYERYL